MRWIIAIREPILGLFQGLVEEFKDGFHHGYFANNSIK